LDEQNGKAGSVCLAVAARSAIARAVGGVSAGHVALQVAKRFGSVSVGVVC